MTNQVQNNLDDFSTQLQCEDYYDDRDQLTPELQTDCAHDTFCPSSTKKVEDWCTWCDVEYNYGIERTLTEMVEDYTGSKKIGNLNYLECDCLSCAATTETKDVHVPGTSPDDLDQINPGCEVLDFYEYDDCNSLGLNLDEFCLSCAEHYHPELFD